MSRITKPRAICCLLPTLAATVVALAPPAAASTNNLVCDNTSSGWIFCFLDDNGLQFRNEVWTINGGAYPEGDGGNNIGFICAPSSYSIGVSYVDETGTPRVDTRSKNCRSGPSQ
jgi:hypothetical protein